MKQKVIVFFKDKKGKISKLNKTKQLRLYVQYPNYPPQPIEQKYSKHKYKNKKDYLAKIQKKQQKDYEYLIMSEQKPDYVEIYQDYETKRKVNINIKRSYEKIRGGVIKRHNYKFESRVGINHRLLFESLGLEKFYEKSRKGRRVDIEFKGNTLDPNFGWWKKVDIRLRSGHHIREARERLYFNVSNIYKQVQIDVGKWKSLRKSFDVNFANWIYFTLREKLHEHNITITPKKYKLFDELKRSTALIVSKPIAGSKREYKHRVEVDIYELQKALRVDMTVSEYIPNKKITKKATPKKRKRK